MVSIKFSLKLLNFQSQIEAERRVQVEASECCLALSEALAASKLNVNGISCGEVLSFQCSVVGSAPLLM